MSDDKIDETPSVGDAIAVTWGAVLMTLFTIGLAYGSVWMLDRVLHANGGMRDLLGGLLVGWFGVGTGVIGFFAAQEAVRMWPQVFRRGGAP